jgi:hypothetical protein
MNKSIVIASASLLCIVLVLAAGCTQPATPPVTPTPTPVITTTPPVTPTPKPTSISSTPGPTQTLPDIWSLDVQVRGNGESIDPQIISTVQGGKGLNFILQVDVRVTRPDGVIENGIIAKPLFVGKSVSLPITSQMGNVNRVEVWATNPQGEKVKIFDDYVPFRTYN